MIFEYRGNRYPRYIKHGNACQFIAATARHYCAGRGLDVGAGKWPLKGAIPVDVTSGGDAMALPKGQFDYIFSSHALEHLNDPVGAIEHWKTRLRPGAWLFLYLPHPAMEYWRPQFNRKHRHIWHPQDIAQMLTDLGFEDVIHGERDLAWGFAVAGRMPCHPTRKAKEFKAKVEALCGNVFSLSALSIRDGAGVLDYVLTTRPCKRVLEVGTFRGLATAYIAMFVESVITIDLADGRLEKDDPTFDRQELWRNLGVNNIELHLVKSNEEKARLIRSLQFDLAFIDGAKYDIAEDFASVKRCGAVLFHDYDERGHPDMDQVFDFVNTLPRDQVQVMDIFALWRASRG